MQTENLDEVTLENKLRRIEAIAINLTSVVKSRRNYIDPNNFLVIARELHGCAVDARFLGKELARRHEKELERSNSIAEETWEHHEPINSRIWGKLAAAEMKIRKLCFRLNIKKKVKKLYNDKRTKRPRRGRREQV